MVLPCAGRQLCSTQSAPCQGGWARTLSPSWGVRLGEVCRLLGLGAASGGRLSGVLVSAVRCTAALPGPAHDARAVKALPV